MKKNKILFYVLSISFFICFYFIFLHNSRDARKRSLRIQIFAELQQTFNIIYNKYNQYPSSKKLLHAISNKHKQYMIDNSMKVYYSNMAIVLKDGEKWYMIILSDEGYWKLKMSINKEGKTILEMKYVKGEKMLPNDIDKYMIIPQAIY